MKKITLLLAAVIIPFGIGTSHAAVTMTINSTDGSWNASATGPVAVGFQFFFSSYTSQWFDTGLTGVGVTTSSAPFSYSGTYNGSSVSGTGTISVDSVTPSFTPRHLNLTFSNGLSAAGTFSALTITPSSPLTGAPNYNNIQSGSIVASNPNTNAPAQVVVVPEPGTSLLAGLSCLLLCHRRRRP